MRMLAPLLLPVIALPLMYLRMGLDVVRWGLLHYRKGQYFHPLPHKLKSFHHGALRSWSSTSADIQGGPFFLHEMTRLTASKGLVLLHCACFLGDASPWLPRPALCLPFW